MAEPKWMDEPEEHDYLAAYDYLTLLYSPSLAGHLKAGLMRAMTVSRKAKDILRASGLDLLPKTNKHVKADMDKGELSPVLLVVHDGRLTVADGYHRICAAWHMSEDSEVRCRIFWEL